MMINYKRDGKSHL